MNLKSITKPILSIESTGTAASIAIGKQGVILTSRFFNSGKQGSELLSAAIDEALHSLNIKPSMLGAVCVSLGPGSFTALRISISTAEALRLALEIPLYGINTLALIAAAFTGCNKTIRVIQDAYKGEFYSGTFQIKQGEVVQQGALVTITPEQFMATLNQDEIICGSGIAKLNKLELNPAEKGAEVYEGFLSIPNAAGLLDYLYRQEEAEPMSIPIEPVYIRASEAEISYQQRFGFES